MKKTRAVKAWGLKRNGKLLAIAGRSKCYVNQKAIATMDDENVRVEIRELRRGNK